MDSWVISAQGKFSKNTDLFPGNISNNFKGCPMKALVFDGQWDFTTEYEILAYSNGTVLTYITGLEMKILMIVLQQMNMTFIYVSLKKFL